MDRCSSLIGMVPSRSLDLDDDSREIILIAEKDVMFTGTRASSNPCITKSNGRGISFGRGVVLQIALHMIKAAPPETAAQVLMHGRVCHADSFLHVQRLSGAVKFPRNFLTLDDGRYGSPTCGRIAGDGYGD